MNEERNSAIGQELQQARLDKGLSLDDIQQSTKIQKRYLAAIESGQFDQLPGAFYERAFVRQYATAVGLDAVAFMQKYENEDTEIVAPDLSAARVDADNVTRAGMHQTEETVADKTRSMMPKIIIGVVIVAIIAIIWVVVSSFAGSAKQESKNQSTVSVTTSQVASKKASSKKSATSTTASSESKSSSASSSSKASSKSSSEKKTAKADKVDLGQGTVSGTTVTYNSVKAPNKTMKMQLKAENGSSWMQVSDAAGTVLWNGTVADGKTQEVDIPTTATGVSVSIGNALATKVSLNNKAVDLQSSNASVWHLGMTFTR